MERDLQIHSEDDDRLRAELAHVVEFFHELGHERCAMFFGWAWTGPDKTRLAMKTRDIPLLDLDAEIRRAEDAGLGHFAQDDVWVEFKGFTLKFQFCHHGGIHLFYSEPNELTRHFHDRWQAEGLEPMEFEKAQGASEWRRASGECA